MGLGAALYRRFLDDVAPAGIRTVRAITGPQNTASIAFHTAVGRTVVLRREHADASISANVVAGVHHDHVFVPYEQGDAAVRVLAALAAGAR